MRRDWAPAFAGEALMGIFELLPHPDFPSASITSICVEIERPDSEALSLTYRVTGRLANILVPDEVEPGFTDGLWRETCLEAFLSTHDPSRYWEFNLSPSGRYAAYGFDDYRIGMKPMPDFWISKIGESRSADCIELFWLIQRIKVDETGAQPLGLSSVIAERDGTKSYWALGHAPGPPDFHNRDCWTATLPAPDPS
ncbi:MAG: hypothetical protein B7Y47_12710 [Sphingomonas sp. 28-63-12]|nr:MAG: hypothetical protein B7Y47_12710 [Sphingomonas sp. 28-63-12]